MKQSKKRFQVRYHLGKGPNYMCWQVTDRVNNHIDYYPPSIVSLELTNCKLRNSIPTAMKIFNGQNKAVCAAVDCDMIDVRYKRDPKFSPPNIKNMDKYKYNPRKHFHWFTKRNRNADDKELYKMYTHNRSIYGKVSKVHS